MANIQLTPPVVDVVDNCKTNKVIVSTGYTHIGGTSTKDPVFNDGYVNLNVNNNTVRYDNMSIPDNFAMQLKGRNFQKDSKIANLFNTDDSNVNVELWYYGTYVALYVTPDYFIYSNILAEEPQANQDVTIFIQKIDNLYHIEYGVN